MIHLDTNYLIGLLAKGSAQAQEVDDWLVSGQTFAASSIAWTEFLNGPITPLEISQAEAVLRSRIVPFGRPEAVLAADLFNKTGRRRGSRFVTIQLPGERGRPARTRRRLAGGTFPST